VNCMDVLLIYLFGELVRRMIVVQMHSLRVSATYNKEFQVKLLIALVSVYGYEYNMKRLIS
jgi:hypothetical protein